MRKLKKRGNVIGLEVLIFLILNTIFFVTMLLFVNDVGTRAFVYEEAYAKQIALIIDNARPEMSILLDITDVVETAEKNNKNFNEVFLLDKENNRVKVSLGNRGYSYQYFSDYNVDLKMDGNWLSIVVLDKGVGNE